MISAIVIDDELAACKSLIGIINTYLPEVNVIGKAHSMKQGLDLLNSKTPDVLFLDIEMPDGSGFELLRQLPHINFDIIFVTAYNQYAIDAFKVSAFDYLLKPIRIKDLKACIARYQTTHPPQNQTKNLETLFQQLSLPQERQLIVPNPSGFNVIQVADILYCEGENNYTRFHLDNKKSVIASKTLKDYEEILDTQGFYRIHQSYIVNLKQIEGYTRGNHPEVSLRGGNILPVSRRRKEGFLGRFL